MREKERGGWPYEKDDFFWKKLDGEPWAFSNTPFYMGG